MVMMLIHLLCSVVNLFREIYETKLGTMGRVMRLLEVVGIGSYGVFIIQGLWNISITHFWIHFKKVNPDLNIRECMEDRDKLFKMAGTTTSLAEIEVLIYFTFITTIVFYVARSRCKKSGIDNSE